MAASKKLRSLAEIGRDYTPPLSAPNPTFKSIFNLIINLLIAVVFYSWRKTLRYEETTMRMIDGNEILAEINDLTKIEEILYPRIDVIVFQNVFTQYQKQCLVVY